MVEFESGTRWEDACSSWGVEEEDAVDAVERSVIGIKLKVGEGGCARLEAHFCASNGALVKGDGKVLRGRLATD